MDDMYWVLVDGEPVRASGCLHWAQWISQARGTGELIIGESRRGDVRVATTFLGLNQAHFGGPPLIYETMVFGGHHDGAQMRYTNRQTAEEGHRAMVLLVLGCQEPETAIPL